MAPRSLLESLRQQIASCETQLQDLRQQLAEAERSERQRRAHDHPQHTSSIDPLTHDMSYGIHDDFRSEVFAVLSHVDEQRPAASRWPLEPTEYKRYGRQLIMPQIGIQGQLRLKNASILIVGVGGLGCPAAAYLVGAGIGTVGLIDGDVVEESNLHRQILHSTARVGMTKVDSARVYLSSLNPNVNIIAHASRLTPETALQTVRPYDLVLDCTDTPASRYLISDTCVLLGKPLVSASALRTDGQLMVLNNPPLPPGEVQGGPCYRCVFPKPPPPESVVSCGDGGILGPVVGTMGVLQALEAIKVLTRETDQSPVRSSTPDPPSLLIFSAYASPMFRSIRLRNRKAKCAACSAQASISAEAITSGSLDYVQFCGAINPVDALKANERISVDNYAKVRLEVNPFTGTEPSKDSHILVDVREKVQFDICNLEGSVNIPFSVVSSTQAPITSSQNNGEQTPAVPEWVSALRSHPEKPIFIVCRLGNDSQISVKKMKELGLDNGGQRWIGDIKGGLRAWRENIDPEFPDY
ncbi:molybdopterin biosynthesis protein moeB [Aaosphaeria arxii CBS 175.79]|uniref:Adenylyltransferase and sulfurtransferase uba4 n=1 Tax=Aaosphaeria arxii CBS 175.79 TaxID=1450172 RepID=A0A6A5XXT6_9PLEO|nr:molybdopterin biosynthesis protein moeB [Aaosphaeria arxii CBS 175.79]KAF2017637.1 molybdopterin biosynthesis protein moeB [Aaosphaeria arxii CBS 175.79]